MGSGCIVAFLQQFGVAEADGGEFLHGENISEYEFVTFLSLQIIEYEPSACLTSFLLSSTTRNLPDFVLTL